MRQATPRPLPVLALTAAMLVLALAGAPASYAAVTTYLVTLDGASESPPNASYAFGSGQVDVDPVAHTMRVQVTFADLEGTVTASHIHGPTAVAGVGNASVATTTPTFTGFPSGVHFGSYDHTFDMTQTSSFNPSFVTNNGGTAASAEAALYAAMAAGKAYLNIHSTSYGGGEIRGFLVPANPTPVTAGTWGTIKSLYR